jgi:hypothetical protein
VKTGELHEKPLSGHPIIAVIPDIHEFDESIHVECHITY